jgi:anaerobic selenocysteine-containing dehydrogenase
VIASKEDKEQKGGWLDSGVSRRSFLKSTSVLAAGAAVGATFFRENVAKAANFGSPDLIDTDSNADVKYSVCLACHSACGIRCKVVNGILVKVDGNPYHPNCLEQHLDYDTDPAVAKTTLGRTCAKGQAGIQVLYNPHRIKEPLRRVAGTPRGGGQWETITWDQAFTEIATKLNALRDLTTDVDSNDANMGKKVNQIIFSGGRNEHGQKEFTDRFFGSSVGTANKRHDHTSICEVSHHVAYELVTGKGIESKTKTKASTDLPNCDFVLWFGSDPCSANFPFVPQSRKLIEMLQRGGKLAVVDPRCNVAASKADWWLPIKPGADGALALAIARYIIDNNLYNTGFLQRPHSGAANPTSEENVTDATLLVKIVSGHATAFLRADEAGIAGGTSSDFVVWNSGAAAQHDTVDTGDLLPGQVTVNGITCKTAFELYVESVRSRTLSEYSTLCGIDVATIQTIAQELTAHGRRVSVEHYRGSVQHTNGTYNAMAIILLNSLVGNYNWKGGHVFGGSHWHETGGKAGNQYTPGTVTNGVSTSGVEITRVKSNYEDSTEFTNNGYPATRPWFPFAYHYNYQEIIPSIDDAYPYACGALILYWNDIAYSTPAAKAVTERVMKDESKVPFSVSIDIEMGETSALCDLVLPDTTYMERHSTPHVGSAIQTDTSGVRQPVVGSYDASMNYTPYLTNTKTLEDILIGIGKAMGIPLDGEDKDGNPITMNNEWDWHRQLIANIAGEGSGVPGGTEQAQIDYVLARGGRFENADQAYDGDKMAHKFTGRIYFFSETLGSAKDSMTGNPFDGFAKYEPVADLLDNLVDVTDAAYPLTLLTYKQAWHSMARTICNPWLVAIQSENFVEINSVDAQSRGIQTGDQVKVTSASLPNGAVGLALVTETVRPGVIAIAHSFGHWQMSSKSYKVNGVDSSTEPTRANGIAANPIMRADPQMPNVTLQDKIGGSSSFYDTRVQVAKV